MTPEMLQEATVLQCISMFVGHSRYPILFGHFVCTSVHILSLMSAAYILFFFRVKVRAFAHKGHVSAGRFQVFGIKTFFGGRHLNFSHLPFLKSQLSVAWHGD